MLRGLMKMAAIAGVGYAWRKFRNRDTGRDAYARERFAGTGRGGFTGTERRFGARDRRGAYAGAGLS